MEFKEAYELKIGQHVEKKGKFSYLSCEENLGVGSDTTTRGHKRKIRRKGSGTIDCGYVRVKINGVSKRRHVLIAENVLGKELPKGAQVHHIDGDTLNDSNSNLVICQDDKYHKLLHVRQRAYVATNDARKRKCCFCKKYDSVDNLSFIQNRNYHKSCQNIYQRERYHARKQK